MNSKRGQRRLRSATRPSVLGNGLLERARSTSLALLGLTAAVGLAMIALALNQGWPLIAGAPIPGFGDEHQAIGDATIAAQAKAPEGPGPTLLSTTARRGPEDSTRPPGKDAGGKPSPAGSKPPQAEGIVVSHPTSASPPGGGSPGAATPNPEPVAQQPATVPAAEPTSGPAVSPPSSAPQPSSEPPASAQSVLVSDEGRERGRHPGRGPSRGTGYSKGENDLESSGSTTKPEAAPSLPAAPPAPSEAAEEPGSDESYAQSRGRGSSRGQGHGRGHDHR